MKQLSLFTLFSVLLFFISCTDSIEIKRDVIIGQELTFEATFGDEPFTKTVVQSDGKSIWWSAHEDINIFYGDSESSKFTSMNAEPVAKAKFKGSIEGFTGETETGETASFWAIYPYDASNTCNGSSITATLPDVQIAKAETFSDKQWMTLAKSSGLALSFYAVGAGFRFSVTKEGVTSVTFKGNNDEVLAGKARISMDTNNRPVVLEHLSEEKELTLFAPGSEAFEVGKLYYIAFYPTNFTKGFTVTFNTSTETGTRVYGSAIDFKRSDVHRGINFDQNVEYTNNPNANNLPFGVEGGTESGLYIGLTYFGSGLTPFPLKKLTGESLTEFNTFIDSRTDLDYQTWLYYAVDKSMARLSVAQFPDDLFNVAIVTFTDGQDDGSSYQKGKEQGRVYREGEYEEELANILEDTVHGISVTAYSVGLGNSNDVVFKNDVQTIAHPSTKWSVVDNMDAVNNEFKAIAQELSNTIKLQKFIGKIPGQASGIKIRFTFDNISEANGAAANSELYIEGVFDYPQGNLDNPVLTNVVYRGLSSTSGDTVQGVDTGDGRVEFSFSGLRRDDNIDLDLEYYKRWIYRTKLSTWQFYRETQSESASIITKEVKSAAIILNLDCTYSLTTENFNKLKLYSKEFISTLYESSIDPDMVQGVALDKSSLDLSINESVILVATVNPSTAVDKTVTWKSSNTGVATVDNNGLVRGVAPGNATIEVKTRDGEFKAYCAVKVSYYPVESIALNKTEMTLYSGKKETLFAAISPDNASIRDVEWESSNPAVATVSSTGEVTGVANGTATITATTTDGGKTATCVVTVANYAPSSTPLDLSLAVTIKETGARGYIAQSELQFADMSKYEPFGLTVLSRNGNFIIALEDASSGMLYKWPATNYYYLPTREQGITISARFTDINKAFDHFGGEKLNNNSRYWTSSAASSSYNYVIIGSGSLDYGYSEALVREVIDISNQNVSAFVTKSKGIYFTYQLNGTRHFVSQVGDIPEGCTPEGIAVKSTIGKGNVILSLQIESSDSMTWSTANSTFSSEHFPTNEQARLLHARMPEVKALLSSNGYSLLINNNNVYYWTSTAEVGSSSRHHVLYSNGSYGDDYTMYNSDKCYVRYALGTF